MHLVQHQSCTCRTHVRYHDNINNSSFEDMWEVTLESGVKWLYKGVIVANGHHWDKRIPKQYDGTFTGKKIYARQKRTTFQLYFSFRSCPFLPCISLSEHLGISIHSKDYKNPDMIKGKRVLIVGGGNSACDIAVEASRFGESARIT